MKTTTLAIIFIAAIGCSKDKPKTVATVPTPPPAEPAKPVDNSLLKEDLPVSQGLAVSPEILQACGIKAPTANPSFDYDKDELSPEDRQVLDQIATCFTTGALKGKALSLIGRADPRGTEEYNLGLGSRRAATVSSYLERLGVAKAQLGVTTRGALDATGTDEAGWQKDRRVDLQLAQSEPASS
ncbi:MAG TPA: OmpA family protein [Kofleriaceae bacterium]|nr:OmpA family protein [Kofleriaceae bacterium]